MADAKKEPFITINNIRKNHNKIKNTSSKALVPGKTSYEFYQRSQKLYYLSAAPVRVSRTRIIRTRFLLKSQTITLTHASALFKPLMHFALQVKVSVRGDTKVIPNPHTFI